MARKTAKFPFEFKEFFDSVPCDSSDQLLSKPTLIMADAIMTFESPLRITAALLVIGDEILSGRTKDKNIGFIAEYLTAIGIELREVRVVADHESAVIDAINALRIRNDYLFTTGGIGPTHDDITADCVAKALNVEIDHDPRAIAMLRERYTNPDDLNEARLRMARIPHNAHLIENHISKAPGFMIENVIVMAGVPSIMQNMIENVTPRLKTGVKLRSVSVDAESLPEGQYAAELGRIQKLFPDVIIGSYPHFDGNVFRNQIVLRSRDEEQLAKAKQDIETLVSSLSQSINLKIPL